MDGIDVDAPLLCHRCGSMLTMGEGSFWIVRINAVCDPTPPELDTAEPIDDFYRRWQELLDAMDEMSEQELLDQVYRRVTLQLCSTCFRGWIENPAP